MRQKLSNSTRKQSQSSTASELPDPWLKVAGISMAQSITDSKAKAMVECGCGLVAPQGRNWYLLKSHKVHACLTLDSPSPVSCCFFPPQTPLGNQIEMTTWTPPQLPISQHLGINTPKCSWKVLPALETPQTSYSTQVISSSFVPSFLIPNKIYYLGKGDALEGKAGAIDASQKWDEDDAEREKRVVRYANKGKYTGFGASISKWSWETHGRWCQNFEFRDDVPAHIFLLLLSILVSTYFVFLSDSVEKGNLESAVGCSRKDTWAGMEGGHGLCTLP